VTDYGTELQTEKNKQTNQDSVNIIYSAPANAIHDMYMPISTSKRSQGYVCSLSTALCSYLAKHVFKQDNNVGTYDTTTHKNAESS